LLVQMIGRGMRLHPGKKNCHIIDMVASLSTGIVSTPTLFGLDPNEVVEESSPADMETIQRKKLAEEMRKKGSAELSGFTQPARNISNTVTFTDYDSVYDLIGDISVDHHIRKMSPHAWVNVNPEKFVLANSNGSYLKLEPNPDAEAGGDGFIVTETAAIPAGLSITAPFRKPRQIAKAATIADAVHAADTYAAKKYPFQFISRRAQWRNRPATDGQIAFLNKIRPKEDQLTADQITKGRAGDMITKLKHGARGRFANINAARKREGKFQAKLEQQQALKERERVSVGPLLD
jgi:ATP-dependent helicase IRC3